MNDGRLEQTAGDDQLSIPRQRDIHACERGAEVLADWLDALDALEQGLGEPDEQDLWSISDLALGGASDTEIAHAIRQARQGGWSWAPIALLLAESPQYTRHRV